MLTLFSPATALRADLVDPPGLPRAADGESRCSARFHAGLGASFLASELPS